MNDVNMLNRLDEAGNAGDPLAKAAAELIHYLENELNRLTRGDVSEVVTTLGDALTRIGKLERTLQSWHQAHTPPTDTDEFFALPIRSTIQAVYGTGAPRPVVWPKRRYVVYPDTVFMGHDAEGHVFVLGLDELGFCRRAWV